MSNSNTESPSSSSTTTSNSPTPITNSNDSSLNNSASNTPVMQPLKTPPTLLSSDINNCAGGNISTGRLIVVANRLPLSMSIKNGEISFSSSSGGLVSALRGIGLDMLWCGWPGGEVLTEEDQLLVTNQLYSQQCSPVFLTSSQADLFYNGFCNNILWPLFHYLPLPIEAIQMHDEQFEAYKSANQLFASVVLKLYRPNDIVWIHDYHLMLLPELLRAKHPEMKIGFFFHTPFPSSEIYRVLPSRAELLRGVLAANLIGFHTADYSRHFATACSRICSAQVSGEKIRYGSNLSSLGSFPIGIDPLKFVEALKTSVVQSYIKEFNEKFSGRKVILGIDRLDYIKGIAHKLLAYEKFLTKHPEFIGKVVLVQIAVPSRTDVVEYQKLRSNIHELVGRLNGKFGTVSSLPVHYLDQSIPFDQMTALYHISDVMFITSVRDGMNLVAYEYLASQENRAGVLILSEFAGASQALAPLPATLTINPHDSTQTSTALYEALTMDEESKRQLHTNGFNYVMNHTAARWARKFVSQLRAYPIETPRNLTRAMISPSGHSLINENHKDWFFDDGLVNKLDEQTQLALKNINQQKLNITGKSLLNANSDFSTSKSNIQLPK